MKTLNKPNFLGLAVYASSFESQKSFLQKAAGKGAPVFTSLHISEEFTPEYPATVREMCRWLNQNQFTILADVSPKTLKIFGTNSITQLAKELGVHALRLDYGFTEAETTAIGKEVPLVVNGSTLDEEMLARLKQSAEKGLEALHNFYPRPETGLDDQLFASLNAGMNRLEIPVAAFIAGDDKKRGPLELGLPTLEKHRNVAPLAAFADLTRNFGVQHIFLGDITLSDAEFSLIQSYCETGVLPVPAVLDETANHLYHQVFTSRPDSPLGTVRFTESREYSCFGGEVPPCNTAERTVGTITVDNSLYKRYSGEVQLMRQDRPADPRVNVVGHVPEAYRLLLPSIHNGTRFMLVPVGTTL